MGQANFKVVLTGAVLEGFEQEQVIESTARIFKCSAQHAERFLQGKATILKREMDAATAERYRDHLGKVGIECRLEPTLPQQPVLELSEDCGVSPASDQAGLSLVPPLAEEQPASPPDSAALSLENSPTSRDAATTNKDGFHCPKCGVSQECGAECVQCGIIFSRYQLSEVSYTSESDPEASELDDWNEIELFVGKNMDRYQFNFRRLQNNDGKFQVSWHWPAFLAPVPWMIYRKLYIWAGVFMLAQLVLPLVGVFAIYILMGLLGNFLYFQRANQSLGKITSQGDSRRDDIVRAGGTNSMIFTIGVTILAGILMTIIFYLFFMPAEMKQAMEQNQRTLQEIADVGDDPTKQQMLVLKSVLVMNKGLSKSANRKFEMPRDMEELRKMTGVDSSATADKWGTPMEFEMKGDTMMFYSAGEDKAFNTVDDVVLETPFE